jgi:hypothetical protein
LRVAGLLRQQCAFRNGVPCFLNDVEHGLLRGGLDAEKISDIRRSSDETAGHEQVRANAVKFSLHQLQSRLSQDGIWSTGEILLQYCGLDNGITSVDWRVPFDTDPHVVRLCIFRRFDRDTSVGAARFLYRTLPITGVNLTGCKLEQNPTAVLSGILIAAICQDDDADLRARDHSDIGG